MNNKWLVYLVAIAAVLIAGSAAYFSVTGLGVLFSGAAIAVMVMAGSLEFAKLVTATYLKQNWDVIKGFNKWYLTIAVAILMLITSAGIFGYLSNAFQQQSLVLDQVQRQIDVWDIKIKSNNDQIESLTKQLEGLQSNQGTILEKGKVNNRLLRSIDNRDKQVSKLQDKISDLQDLNVAQNDSINKIKTNNISIEKEVGGFRFVADAFGVDLKVVVKFFIFLIVIVFDPLAIALIIAFNQLSMDTKKEDDEEVEEEKEKEKIVIDAKDIVSEVSRLRLSEEDLNKLESILLNPPKPNENLKSAADEYKKREDILSEMMKSDQELGLYEESFENPMDKEEDEKWDGISQEVWDRMEVIEKQRELIHGPITEEDLPPTGALANSEYRQEENDEFVIKTTDQMTDEEIDEYYRPTETQLIEQEIEELIEKEIELNFSDEFIEQAIAEFNQESLEQEAWDEELEKQYVEEQVPELFETLEEVIVDEEPIYQSETKEVDQINEIVDTVINEPEPVDTRVIDRTNVISQDGLFFSQAVSENVQDTSSETNDEKKKLESLTQESDLTILEKEETPILESQDSKVTEDLYWETDDVNPNIVIYDLENNQTIIPTSEEEITGQPKKVISRNVSSRRRNNR